MKTVWDIEIPDRACLREGGSYGDQYVAGKYCGFSFPPYRINGEWQHGWVASERNIHPEFAVSGDGKSYDRRERSAFYVARQDQVDYLNSVGYTKVYAVGLPIVYVEKPRLERIAGSLLVMPKHSLPETKEGWDADLYATYIKSIARRFSALCLCVHKSCADKGNWVTAFDGLDIRVVVGADESDHNSLVRMAFLFSQFEFVTSNSFGSHVAYASYFGCKVSVAGPAPSWKRQDYEDLTFYKNAPEVLDIQDEWNREDRWGKLFPQFLKEPWNAIAQQQWAAWQLGEQHKKSPRDLRKLFGWDWAGKSLRAIRWGGRFVRAGYQVGLKSVKLLPTLGLPGLVAAIQLKLAARRRSGTTVVWCSWKRRLTLRNGTSDVDVFEKHFIRREILDIPLPKNISTVLDLGANIGISVEVFRRMFPGARVIAIELEKQNAELCKANHASDPLVTVINGAVWSRAGTVGVKDVGDKEWAYQVQPEAHGEAGGIPAFTYSQILAKHGLRSVDVMKMDIEGAEANVLEASWPDIFRVTAVAIIEIHDWIKNTPARVQQTLEQAKKQFDLEISRSGEFWVIRNRKLIAR